MIKSPKISIIIPVYNGVEFLDSCIKGVFNQTFCDYEVLLINDGSTDGSLARCYDYAKIDTRVRVISSEKNRGVSYSRQIGVDMSRGEYTIHVDVDDKIEPSMLEEMYNYAKGNNLDILITDYYVNSDLYIEQSLSFSTNRDIVKSILTGKTLGSMWNKLVKTSLYKEKKVSFPKGVNYCEDVFVIISLLLHEDISIGFLKKAYYHYFINPKSITNFPNIKTINGRILFVGLLSEVLLQNNVSTDLLNWHKIDIKYSMFKTGLFPYSEFKKIFPEVFPECLIYNYSPKRKRFAVFFISINKFLWIITRCMNKYV